MIKICKEVPQDVMRDMQALLEEKIEKKELKKKQQEEIAQLVGTRSVQGSSSYHGHGHPPVPPSSTTASQIGSIGPRVRKQRPSLDSIFVPLTTLGAQPSLESMTWNKEKHEQAKLALEISSSTTTFHLM